MINTSERASPGKGLVSLSDVRGGILSETEDTTITIYQLWTEWLVSIGVADAALNVGMRAPDFLLPDVDGRLVCSRDLLKDGPIIVSFIRGGWCPFCVAEMRAYQSRLAQQDCPSINVVIITPDAGRYPRQMKRKFGLDLLQVVSDVSYGLTLSFGLLTPVPPIGKIHLVSRGIDLAERHGSAVPMLPLPATYILDRSGFIKRTFVDADFTRRDEPELVFEAVRGL